MKKVLLVAAGLIASVASFAADNYLHIRTSAGWEVIDLDRVDRLTFVGNSMIATDASQNTVSTYDRTDLQSMKVDNEPAAGIAEITGDGAENSFSFDASSRTVTVAADGSFEIYDLKGSLLVVIPEVKKGETVAMTGLAPGVVIIKSGIHSAKVVIK